MAGFCPSNFCCLFFLFVFTSEVICFTTYHLGSPNARQLQSVTASRTLQLASHRAPFRKQMWKRMISSHSLARKLLPTVNLSPELGNDQSTNNNLSNADKPSQPIINNDIIESVVAPTLSEVSWRDCYAENIYARFGFGLDMRCEFWAPLGSNVSWYKDEKLLSFHPHEELSWGQEPLSTNERGDEYTMSVNPGRSKYEFYLMSIYYIDCFKQSDEGKYDLVIHTPNGNNYSRDFRLHGKGLSFLAWSLWCRTHPPSLPIIEHFAKTVVGKKGSELFLPCRVQNVYTYNIDWEKVDRELTTDHYSITDNGDLHIHELSLQDEGMFICKLYFDFLDEPFDEISTFVKVIE